MTRTQAEEVEAAVRLAQDIVETYAKSKGSRELSHSVRDALLLSKALLAARDDAAQAERTQIVEWLDAKAEQAIENDRRDFSDALGYAAECIRDGTYLTTYRVKGA